MAACDNPDMAGTITSLLEQARRGSKSASDEVFALTYAELRSIAQQQPAAVRQDAPLDATALVSAACERLLGANKLDAQNRRHFFFLLGRAMHDVVVEEIRAAAALKRGGAHRHVPFVEVEADGDSHSFDMNDLHAALSELQGRDPDAAQIVMLRFFAHRSLQEAAELMGCTFAVARRHWDYAKAWLHERLSSERPSAS